MSKTWAQIKNSSPSPAYDDETYMLTALGLAQRGLGNVWPNPAVGCLIVKDNTVIGRGWTQPGGRPHAETQALAQAGQGANGATVYVTLEPCAHHGKTPPCAQALIDAKVSRVVVSCIDPDERVSGKGLAMLRSAGIDVVSGVCEQQGEDLNEGFMRTVREKRPMFTLKMATTLDGRIAVHTGESQWITARDTRQIAHKLRASHDAIMVGIGTASDDNPMLTCRLPGLEDRSPVRIVLDRRLRLPLTSELVMSAHEIPTWLITLGDLNDFRAKAFQEAGIELISAPPDARGGITLPWVGQELARRGITRVLVEGGSHLAAALLRRDLVDRLVWMRAPRLIGHDGIPAAQAFGIDRLDDTPMFERVSFHELDIDTVETYRIKRS